MGATLQPPLIIGIAGTLAGLLMALFSAGLSRLPVWKNGRRFGLVALTCAGYCAADLATVLNLSPAATAFGVQLSLLFGVAHGVSWLWYLAALEERVPDRFERSAAFLGLVAGLIGMIPGTFVTSEITTIRVDWFGAVYRTPRPTDLGVAVFVYLALTMTVVALRAARRRASGGRDRMLVAAVALLGVFGVNDTLVNGGHWSMPMLLDGGSVLVVLLVGFTSQRRLAEDLLQAQRALGHSERLASTGRLAAGIAHEINNPAAVIRHDLEQVLRGRGDTYQHIDHALAALDRIVNVVRRLLDLEPALRPGLPALASFPLTPVLERVQASVQSQLTHGRLTVEVERDLVAVGDPARVEAVLTSLLSNAVRAIDGVPQGHVSIRAVARGDRTEIVVADNGGGLPPEILKRLFEPFVHATPQEQHASGLGLAVAYGLMRSQNGALQLLKTSPQGTEIALDLPRTVVHSAIPVRDSDATPEARPLSLLIIDDDPELRMVLKDAAETHGLRAVVAETVAEGLEWLDAGATVDVVLCDLMMPDGGADVWLKHCRRKFPTLADRTIIITGGATSPAALELAEANAGRLLYKPFAMAEVRTMANKLLEL
ncbi:MAG: ATP-binding protein [Acidobacteriota bacterium]